jgi:restriction system protein
MANLDYTVWGIHGGASGDADTLFLKHRCIALGWARLGDLSKVGTTREAFKAAVAKRWPEKKPAAVPNNAGQLFRFVYEMKPGDLVVYPSKRDKLIHIGRVTGPYVFDPKGEEAYPNRRAVEWKAAVPRSRFTQGGLYEVGSAMSLFQVKTYADEFIEAAEGKAPPATEGKDDTVGRVAEQTETNTRDYVLKKLAEELKGHALAHFVAHLLEAMGYRTRVASEGPDGGVDIVAHRDELGFEPPIIKVQVKATEANIGDPIVSSLYGKVGASEFGLFVTLGGFTADARKFARQKSNLRLVDGDALVELVYQHYERFNSVYKGVIPLKRVFVPDAIEESEEE